MILVLQTNLDERVECWVVQKSIIIGRISKKQTFERRVIPLVLVDQLLKKGKIMPKKLSGVVIIRGPGRFSAVRTGILIGNILSQELHIPVLGLVRKNLLTDDMVITAAEKVGAMKSCRAIKPWYGKKPNITKPKKR